jgi:hypothetical protein
LFALELNFHKAVQVIFAPTLPPSWKAFTSLGCRVEEGRWELQKMTNAWPFPHWEENPLRCASSRLEHSASFDWLLLFSCKIVNY